MRNRILIGAFSIALALLTFTGAALLARHNDKIRGLQPGGSSASSQTSGEPTEYLKDNYLPRLIAPGQSMPNVSFTDENGETVSFSGMKGSVVVLNYWASWCPHCQKELKQADQIAAMLKRHPEVRYWLVDKLDGVKETTQTATSYLKKQKIPLGNLFDRNLSAYHQLGIAVVPTTLVIDKKGVLRVWRVSDGLTAGALESMIEEAEDGGASGVLGFVTGKLTDPDGGVKTNLIAASSATPSGSDVLSESQGLMLQYAVQAKNRPLFTRTLGYIDQKMMKSPLAAWVVTSKGAAQVNAAVDDLRIYRALYDANRLWGGYDGKLSDYENALYEYNTQDGHLVNAYDFEKKQKSDTLNLSYADFDALAGLSGQNSRWDSVCQDSLSVVQNGFIGKKFPFYYSAYHYTTKKYDTASVNMSEELLTVLHLAKIGHLSNGTLSWLQNAVDGDGIFARYTADGKVVDGYRYESTAVYALASLVGDAAGDSRLAHTALLRMEKMRVFDTGSKADGAFGNADGTGIYSFDQCTALLAYAGIIPYK